MRNAIAELYDYKLKDKFNALKYYKSYKIDLQRYINKLKQNEPIKADELDDAEQPIRALNEYIEHMDK